MKRTNDLKVRIRERLTEINDHFHREFVRAYVAEVVGQALGSPSASKRLLVAAPRGDPVKRGRVALRRRWATVPGRLEVLNEKDNFRLDFYKEGRGFLDKRRSLECCGYRPEAVDGSLIRLEHPRQQQVWTLRFVDEAARDAWFSVLRVACRKARPPSDDAIVERAAFERAYRKTRQYCGYVGGTWDNIVLGEAEMLGALEDEVVRDEIARDVPFYKRRVMEGTIGRIAVDASASAWKIAKATAETLRPTLEASMSSSSSSSLGSFVETKDRLKKLLVPGVRDHARQTLDRLKAAVETLMREQVMPAIVDAYAQAIEGFGRLVRPLVATLGDDDGGGGGETKDVAVDEKKKDDARLLLSCRRARHLVDDFTGCGGPMAAPTATLNTRIRDNADLQRVLEQTFPACGADHLLDVVDSSLRSVLHDAIFTFQERCKAPGSSPVDVVRRQVGPMLAHDLQVSLEQNATALFVALYRDEVERNLAPHVEQITQPVEIDYYYSEEIPEDLRPLVSLETCVEEIVEDLIGHSATSLLLLHDDDEKDVTPHTQTLAESARAALDPIAPRPGDYEELTKFFF